MSLYLDGEPNLMALSGGRELSELPWHFTVITLDSDVDLDLARGWIWKNLEGRFCLIQAVSNNRYLPPQMGFEDPMEASAFILSQPLLKRDNSWI